MARMTFIFSSNQCTSNVFPAESSLDFHLLPLLVGDAPPSPVPPRHAHIPKGVDDHTQERRQGEQTVDGRRDGVAVDMLLLWNRKITTLRSNKTWSSLLHMH